jgi:arylsulfatase B
MLGQFDDGVGRVLGRLYAEGLDERTIVVFLSDNGGPTRELTSSNAPLRGEKGQLLEGGIRVPFLMQWKGRLPVGREEARMVSSLDLFPTVLAAAGAEGRADLDGVDLLPHLTKPTDAPIRPSHYWRVGTQAALRQGDWKIVRPRGGVSWQLYDLAQDIGEAHDLATAHPDQLATLLGEWKRLDAEMVAPLWGGAPRKRPSE